MESARVALVLVIFLSVGRSAPVTDCGSLTQTLQINRDHLLGKWFHISESTNIIGSQLLTKMFIDNAWGNFTASSKEDGMNVDFSYKMLGRCFSVSYSLSVVNNTVSMVRPYQSSSVLLHTSCPDCLVFSSNATLGTHTYSSLQLLSRRSEVTEAQLEEFKKQRECLNLPSLVIFNSNKDFCPDKSESQGTKITDLTDTMNNMGSETLDGFFSYIKNESGLQSLFQLFKSGIGALKQQ